MTVLDRNRLTADYCVNIFVWKYKYVGGDINTVKEFFMSKKLIFSIMLVCLLAFVTVWAFAQNSPNVRWEYTSVKRTTDRSSTQADVNATIENINRLGQEGWELVLETNGYLYLKRRLP